MMGLDVENNFLNYREQLERRTTIKIDLGFQQALQGVKSIVSKFSTSSSALSNISLVMISSL